MVKYSAYAFKGQTVSAAELSDAMAELATIEASHGLKWNGAQGSHSKVGTKPARPTALNITSAPIRMATDKQQSYIASLARRAGVELDVATIAFSDASATIDRLKALPVATTVNGSYVTPNSTVAAPITNGMYLVGERIFKVQTSRTSGNLYAKELVNGSFEYAPGAMRLVATGERMTLEQAKAYGRQTGNCCVCGRDLTNAVSVEAGIGPVCAGRL